MKNESIFAPLINKYVVVRSRDQGVMSGYLEAAEGRTARLREARQLYAWSSKFVLIELASYGPRNAHEQRYSAPSVEPVVMTETCGIIGCSETAAALLRDVKPEAHD